MSTNQLAGLTVTLFLGGMAFFKYYLDARIDGVNSQFGSVNSKLDLLVNYMIEHQGKIATLEERTKKL